jgi:hypothetical protein
MFHAFPIDNLSDFNNTPIVNTVKRLVNRKMSEDNTLNYIIPDMQRLQKPMQQITSDVLRKAGGKFGIGVVDLDSRGEIMII